MISLKDNLKQKLILKQRVGDALTKELISLQKQRIDLLLNFMSKSSLASGHLDEAVQPSASSELQSVVSTVKTNRKRQASEVSKRAKKTKGTSADTTAPVSTHRAISSASPDESNNEKATSKKFSKVNAQGSVAASKLWSGTGKFTATKDTAAALVPAVTLGSVNTDNSQAITTDFVFLQHRFE